LLRLEPPVREAAPAEAVKTPKVGLVLGGGAARGFAHVGVIRVLDREKIPIDIIVGTSVGSLVGAIYADKANGAELESISFSLGERDLFDYTFVNPTQGLVRGDRLEEFVAKKLSAREIQQLKLPFAAVATDIQRGEAVVLKSGSVARAVRASSAIPGIFFPVRHQGRLLVDGGVIDNVPASVAREMGADIVIAVSLAAGKRNSQVNNAFDAIMQSLNLMAAQIMERRLKEADVLIQPQVTQYGPVDFSRKKELASAGVRAAEEALPRIREALQNGGLAAR
jgi:NTE family protein